MDLTILPKHLRSVLYKNTDCMTLTTEFERVLEGYDIEVSINISDENKAIIVDIEPLIQFIRTKTNPVRVYECIPVKSPLKGKYVENRYKCRKSIYRTKK